MTYGAIALPRSYPDAAPLGAGFYGVDCVGLRWNWRGPVCSSDELIASLA